MRWAPKTILALFFLLFTFQQAYATNYLTACGVQHVTVTIANGATSGTASLGCTVGSGAFIVWDGQTTGDSTDIPSSASRVELTNTTTVTATRNTSATATVTVNADVVDGDTANLIKSVQSGTTTLATGSTTATSSISAVTNTNTAIFYLGCSSASVSFSRSLCSVTLSGTTVTVARSVSSGADVVGWIAVEFQGAALNSSTQNVTVTSTVSGTSFSTPITSVTTANTLLANGGGIANQTSPAKGFMRLSLASSTAVHGDTNTAPLVVTDIYQCVVVEFVSGVLAQTAQRGTIALSAQTSNTGSITSSATARTLTNWLGNTTTETTLDPATAEHNITLTNATTLTESVNTSASGTGSYEAVNFSTAGPVAFGGNNLWISLDGL